MPRMPPSRPLRLLLVLLGLSVLVLVLAPVLAGVRAGGLRERADLLWRELDAAAPPPADPRPRVDPALLDPPADRAAWLAWAAAPPAARVALPDPFDDEADGASVLDLFEHAREAAAAPSEDPAVGRAVERTARELRAGGTLLHLMSATALAKELRAAVDAGRAPDSWAGLELLPTLDEARGAVLAEARGNLGFLEGRLGEVALPGKLGLFEDDYQHLRVVSAERGMAAVDAADLGALVAALARDEGVRGERLDRRGPAIWEGLFGSTFFETLLATRESETFARLAEETAAWEALRADRGFGAAAPRTGRPNVILVLTDDQGTVDLGACGTDDVVTPTLDRLAAEGLRFTRFYAASSICSPSRAGLLTGRYPQRVGVPGNVWPGGPGLRGEEITLAEVFGEAGYATALFGKWHLGDRPGERPIDQGFERFFGHRLGCIDNWSHYFYWNGPNRHDLWRGDEEVWEDGRHFGDLVVREATGFLRERAADGRPFFLYLPFNSPHYPLQGKAEWRDHFAAAEKPRADYLAMLATTDAQLGEILGELEALGLREDTIVVFQSDHGHSTEERSFRGGGSAGPYRGAKFSLFEGGVRVPAVLSWPGRVPAGATTAATAHATDWMPTLCELAGLEAPPGLDGRSLVGAWDAAPAPRRLHWQVGRQGAVLDGDEKWIVNPRDTDRTELKDADARWLSDLAADPGERRNFANERAERAAELAAVHAAWREEVDGMRPKVLLLGLDGVRADALRAAPTPHLDRLAAAGAFTDRARNVEVSGHSAPNWATLLNGFTPEHHGVSANGDDPDDPAAFPHLFRMVKTARPELHTAAFATWSPIVEALTPDAVADLEFAGGGDDAAVAAAAVRLLAGEEGVEPDVVVVHLDAADHAGHEHGYHAEQPEYLAAIARADALAGVILDALRARPEVERGREQWLVLATTDHGGYGRDGRGTGHSLTGDPEQDEAVRAVWWILSGPGVPVGAELGAPRAVDATPTLLRHLGIDPAVFELDGAPVELGAG